LKQAVHLTPDVHANNPSFHTILGNCFEFRFQYFGDVEDSAAAILHFQHAAKSITGSPSIRFDAALEWAHFALTVNDSSILQAYTAALNLLPQVVWLGQTITTRHRELSSIGVVANEAAAAAISAGQYNTALEWLEQGRSIVWGQLLHLRTPVDLLCDVDPTLAQEITQVSKALEHASNRNTDNQHLSTDVQHPISLEQAARNHHRLAEKWEALVAKVQDIPGFENFLQPKKFSQLLNAAKNGPVVVINVDKNSCDALVLMPGLKNTIHIPLDHFSYEKASHLHQCMNQLLQSADVHTRDARAGRRVATSKEGGFESILSVLWSCVVQPVLSHLAFPVSCSFLHFQPLPY
jgi:hypothetical protein